MQENYWETDPYCQQSGGSPEKQLQCYEDIDEEVMKYVDNLECSVTKNLGIQKYWKKVKDLKTFCGQPCLVIRTFDDHFITFLIAKGMVKVSGLAHTLQNRETGKKAQCSQCLYKLSQLFRNVIIPAYHLSADTLQSDEELKGSYESYAKH